MGHSAERIVQNDESGWGFAKGGGIIGMIRLTAQDARCRVETNAGNKVIYLLAAKH